MALNLVLTVGALYALVDHEDKQSPQRSKALGILEGMDPSRLIDFPPVATEKLKTIQRRRVNRILDDVFGLESTLANLDQVRAPLVFGASVESAGQIAELWLREDGSLFGIIVGPRRGGKEEPD